MKAKVNELDKRVQNLAHDDEEELQMAANGHYMLTPISEAWVLIHLTPEERKELYEVQNQANQHEQKDIDWKSKEYDVWWTELKQLMDRHAAIWNLGEERAKAEPVGAFNDFKLAYHEMKRETTPNDSLAEAGGSA